MKGVLCLVQPCSRDKKYNTGYCTMHHKRFVRNGDAMRVTRKPCAKDWEQNVQQTTSCWLYRGYINNTGYGEFNKKLVHRLSYERYKGKIPSDLQIDHLCRVRHCCNPVHLEAVTQRVNLIRGNGMGGVNARKLVCLNGHHFDGYDHKGARTCNVCQKARQKSANSRRKLQASC